MNEQVEQQQKQGGIDGDLLQKIARERRRQDRIKLLSEACNKRLAAMKEVGLEQFTAAGVRTLRIAGATLYLHPMKADDLARMPNETPEEAAKRAAATLEKHGLGLLVAHPTVILTKLLAEMIDERDKEEQPVPDEVRGLLKREKWDELRVRKT